MLHIFVVFSLLFPSSPQRRGLTHLTKPISASSSGEVTLKYTYKFMHFFFLFVFVLSFFHLIGSNAV